MAITDALLPEFDHEMETTRKLLERVPDAELGWKPHDKSMSLGRLATHVAEIPAWGERILGHDDFDFAGPYSPREEKSREKIVALFDEKSREMRRLLTERTDAELMAPWSLKREGKLMFTTPRAAMLRSMVMNHLVHHRGQLSVYLRLKDVPLPPMYGPTADERGF